jgi:hypothetical protein
MVKPCCLAISTVVLMATAPPVPADMTSSPLTPGRGYMAVALGASGVEAGDFRYGHLPGTNAPAYQFDGSSSGSDVAMTLGYGFTADAVPRWLGASPRAEFTMAYAGTVMRAAGSTPVGTRVPFIDGRLPNNLQFTTANNHRYEREQRRSDLDLLIGGDHDVGAWRMRLTPYFGLTYLRRDTRGLLESTDPGPAVVDLRMLEKLDASYAGAKVGLQLSRGLWPSGELFLGVSASWLRASATLSAHQHFVTYPAPPGTIAQVVRKERASTRAASFEIGIRHDFKVAQLALIVESNSLDYVPVAVYPVLFTDPAVQLSDTRVTERRATVLFTVPFE